MKNLEKGDNMSNFSELFINQLYDLLSHKFEDVFNDIVFPKNKDADRMRSTNFKDFIIEILENDFVDKTNPSDLQDFRNNLVRNSTKMKNNWHKSLLKEIENPKKIREVDWTIMKELQGYERMSPDELKRAFEVSNLDMLLQKRIEEVDKWRSNKDSLFIDFRYFKDKKPYQIFSSFKYDISISIIDIINKYFDGRLDEYMIKRATELIENPIFGINRMLLKFETLIDESSNTPILFNDYYVTDDYYVRTLIKEPEKIETIKCYYLDERDSEIIDLVYSKVNSNFIKDKKIVIDIGEVVKKIYLYSNAYCYKDAEERILRLGLYQLQGLIKENENIETKFVINFFDNVSVSKNYETGKSWATITFGEVLYDLYFKQKTFKISTYQYKRIENALAKILFFPLQKERVGMNLYQDNEVYTKEFNYEYFAYKVRFNSKKKSENMSLIAECLEELKMKKMLIKEYKEQKNGFLIEFIPLSPEEKKVYGINSDDELILEKNSKLMQINSSI